MTTNSKKGTPISFTSAMRDFFGFRPGDGVGQFAQELKALGDEDRSYFVKGLEANGYVIENKVAA
jgi:hypothetical protein